MHYIPLVDVDCIVYIIIGGTILLRLEEVLSFFTGAERIPPGGFDPKPAVTFNCDNMYATASTCAMELCLPTRYHDKPSVFRERMITSFRDHGGFGLK